MDVKILDYPTHAASLPVAMIPNCAATRHTHFVLDGTGPALQTPPDINDWPNITRDVGANVHRINLDTVTRDEAGRWQPGDTLLLSGKMLTGRDAAHKKMKELIESGEGLPPEVDLKGRFIYYVGPVDPVRDEVMGPAGPTTATRMDKFTDFILEHTGLLGMIGKAERGPAGVAAIKKHKAVYYGVVGAAYLVSKAITLQGGCVSGMGWRLSTNLKLKICLSPLRSMLRGPQCMKLGQKSGKRKCRAGYGC